VYFVALTLTLVPVVLMSTFSNPPWGIVIGNYIASLLCGAAMMSIGILISSYTTSQIIAAIGTLVAVMLLTMIDSLVAVVNVSFVQQIIRWISFNNRYYTFTQGVFDIPAVVYFVSLCVVFLFLTARKVESRRWN
jgi:ABC-2 type transport system permease protein